MPAVGLAVLLAKHQQADDAFDVIDILDERSMLRSRKPRDRDGAAGQALAPLRRAKMLPVTPACYERSMKICLAQNATSLFYPSAATGHTAIRSFPKIGTAVATKRRSAWSTATWW